MSGKFRLHDVISMRDITKDDINTVLTLSKEMLDTPQKYRSSMDGKIMATLFFEASTRTRFSFTSAMQRLGGDVWGFSAKSDATSLDKGENLADTIRMADKYVDIIVVRHWMEGAARLAAEVSDAPIINGGDGGNQHPTQTLMDLFTINHLKGKIEGLKVALIGDLKHARTMRSLALALGMYGVELVLVSPPSLRMGPSIKDGLKQKYDIEPIEEEDITSPVVKDADIWYTCRIQKERFIDPFEAKKLSEAFKITLDTLE
ncbi:MAG: aspartate carbamoyltransferase, partial [Candidatus Hodarchaeota archaeon]